jgi:hypothetical protein
MSIEAMKQALRTLDAFTPHGRVTWILTEEVDVDEAVVALRKAIEQTEKQEPVAYIDSNTIEWFLNPKRGKDSFASPTLTKKPSLYCDTPLYTTPPKREWVGLSDDEICEVAEIDGADAWLFEVARAIEAKLKEKNT